MNILSVGGRYGVIVAVFQWGWGRSLLGVEEPIPIETGLPMIMFAILFGLSMDYEVFLLSRIRERYLETGDNLQSVADGLATTGPHHHRRGADHDRRLPQLRPQPAADRQAARRRPRDGGARRRDDRPPAARAGDDGPARRPELVDAALRSTGSSRGSAPARPAVSVAGWHQPPGGRRAASEIVGGSMVARSGRVLRAGARPHGRVRLPHAAADVAAAQRATGFDVRLKAEMFQRGGSYKIRGPMNKFAQLTDEQKRARRRSARRPATTRRASRWRPRTTASRRSSAWPRTPRRRRSRRRAAYGAEVVLHGTIWDEANEKAKQLVAERGYTYIHPFDDRADRRPGDGRARDLRGLARGRAGVVPIGGGGLISGVATALKACNPRSRSSASSRPARRAMKRSVREGQPADARHRRLHHRRARVKRVGETTYEIVRQHRRRSRHAARRADLRRGGLDHVAPEGVPEGAAAAPVAALLQGLVKAPPGTKVVVRAERRQRQPRSAPRRCAGTDVVALAALQLPCKGGLIGFRTPVFCGPRRCARTPTWRGRSGRRGRPALPPARRPDRRRRGRALSRLGRESLRPPRRGGRGRPASSRPNGAELAQALAERSRYPDRDLDLLRVSQYVDAILGERQLYRYLHEVFDADYPPTSLHRLLAALPALLRERGRRSCS